MTEAKKKPTYQAPALDKGLDILEYLAGESVARTQAEVAQALGRNQSEIYRMLSCLESRGYIFKEEGSGCCRLTLRLYQLGHRQHVPTLLRTAARLPMEALAEETGQSCHLSVQHGPSLMVLMERMPARKICLAVGEGATFPLAKTASGKVLLGRMAEEVMNQALVKDDGYVRETKAAQNRLRALLSKTREQGFITEASDLTTGVADIAIPVGVDGTGTAAALAISYLASGGADGSQRKYLRAALSCAEEINRNLGIEP